MTHPTLFALALAASAAIITPTVAHAEPVLATSTVQTADLDLGSAAGREQLRSRLAAAAREVCGTASDTDLKGKNDVRRCRDETLARANARSDALIAAVDEGRPIVIAAIR